MDDINFFGEEANLVFADDALGGDEFGNLFDASLAAQEASDMMNNTDTAAAQLPDLISPKTADDQLATFDDSNMAMTSQMQSDLPSQVPSELPSQIPVGSLNMMPSVQAMNSAQSMSNTMQSVPSPMMHNSPMPQNMPMSHNSPFPSQQPVPTSNQSSGKSLPHAHTNQFIAGPNQPYNSPLPYQPNQTNQTNQVNHSSQTNQSSQSNQTSQSSQGNQGNQGSIQGSLQGGNQESKLSPLGMGVMSPRMPSSLPPGSNQLSSHMPHQPNNHMPVSRTTSLSSIPSSNIQMQRPKPQLLSGNNLGLASGSPNQTNAASGPHMDDPRIHNQVMTPFGTQNSQQQLGRRAMNPQVQSIQGAAMNVNGMSSQSPMLTQSPMMSQSPIMNQSPMNQNPMMNQAMMHDPQMYVRMAPQMQQQMQQQMRMQQSAAIQGSEGNLGSMPNFRSSNVQNIKRESPSNQKRKSISKQGVVSSQDAFGVRQNANALDLQLSSQLNQMSAGDPRGMPNHLSNTQPQQRQYQGPPSNFTPQPNKQSFPIASTGGGTIDDFAGPVTDAKHLNNSQLRYSLGAISLYTQALRFGTHATNLKEVMRRVDSFEPQDQRKIVEKFDQSRQGQTSETAKLPINKLLPVIFWRTLNEVYTHIRRPPVAEQVMLAGKRIPLMILFQYVQISGGYLNASLTGRWEQILRTLGLHPGPNGSVILDLIAFYVNTLLTFEMYADRNEQIRKTLVSKLGPPRPLHLIQPANSESIASFHTNMSQVKDVQKDVRMSNVNDISKASHTTQPPSAMKHPTQGVQDQGIYSPSVEQQHIPAPHGMQYQKPIDFPVNTGMQHVSHSMPNNIHNARLDSKFNPDQQVQTQNGLSQQVNQVNSIGLMPAAILSDHRQPNGSDVNPHMVPSNIAHQGMSELPTTHGIPLNSYINNSVCVDSGSNASCVGTKRLSSEFEGAIKRVRKRSDGTSDVFQMLIEDGKYLLQRRHSSTHGGRNIRYLTSLGNEIENWRPDVAFPLDLGTVDLHAVTCSLASRNPAEVRQALDKLAVVSANPKVHESLQHCPRLLANLCNLIYSMLVQVLKASKGNTTDYILPSTSSRSLKLEDDDIKLLAKTSKGMEPMYKILEKMRKNYDNGGEIEVEVDAKTGFETGKYSERQTQVSQVLHNKMTESLKEPKNVVSGITDDHKDANEEWNSSIEEFHCDESKPYFFPSYCVRYERIEAEICDLGDSKEDLSSFLLTSLCDRLLLASCVLRNISFSVANRPIIAHKPEFQRLLWLFLDACGERPNLLDSELRSLDLCKDFLTVLGNIGLYLRLPDTSTAAKMILFLLGFSPVTSPFNSDGQLKLMDYDIDVHRYLPNAIDVFVKIASREEPNRQLVEEVLLGTSTDLKYKNLMKRWLQAQNRTELYPAELLSRMFALSVMMMPLTHFRPPSRDIETRQPYLLQGTLAAEVLVNMIPEEPIKPGFNIATNWLNSLELFGARMVRTLNFMGMVVLNHQDGESHRPFAKITQRGINIIQRLFKKAKGDPNFLSTGIVPSIEHLLGGLMATKMDKAVVKHLCSLYDEEFESEPIQIES